MPCVVETVPDAACEALLSIHRRVGHATCAPGFDFLAAAGSLKAAWATCPRHEWLIETVRMFGRHLPEYAVRAFLARIVLESSHYPMAALPGSVEAVLRQLADAKAPSTTDLAYSNASAAQAASAVGVSLTYNAAPGAREVASAAREAIEGSAAGALKLVPTQMRNAASTVGGEACVADEMALQVRIFREVVGDFIV